MEFTISEIAKLQDKARNEYLPSAMATPKGVRFAEGKLNETDLEADPSVLVQDGQPGDEVKLYLSPLHATKLSSERQLRLNLQFAELLHKQFG